MDLSPLTDWMQDPQNMSLLLVVAAMLLASATWYGIHRYRRRSASRPELRAEREIAYRSFADALDWVIASLEKEVRATTATDEGRPAEDTWWEEPVGLDSTEYTQALARLRAAANPVKLYGSREARGLADGLVFAAQMAGERHPRRIHREILERVLWWWRKGRDRFRKVARHDLGHDA